MTQGGTVQVLNQEGSVIDAQVVPPPSNNPWWYQRHRKTFWLLGSFFVAQGVYRLTVTVPMVSLGSGGLQPCSEGFTWSP